MNRVSPFLFKPFSSQFLRSSSSLHSRAFQSQKSTFSTNPNSPPTPTQASTPEFSTIQIIRHEKYPYVVQLALNRPDKLNAMNKQFFIDLSQAIQWVDQDPKCRAVVLSGNGKHFCAGLDLKAGLLDLDKREPARQAIFLRQLISGLQDPFTLIESSNKPFLAAIHGACVGGAVDLIAACDIRYSTADAKFTIKEVDIGLAADLGTLQRLPKVTGNGSLLRELVYTGRYFSAEEAKQLGLVSRLFESEEQLIQGSLELANKISEKSPVAIQGSKRNLLFSRDHSTASSLEYAATWNAATLQTADIMKAISQKNNFDDL